MPFGKGKPFLSEGSILGKTPGGWQTAGRRTIQFRVDLQNALNRQQWGNPNLDPTSTSFGLVTTINATVMRFVQFGTRVSF